jgi:hypothetical protein
MTSREMEVRILVRLGIGAAIAFTFLMGIAVPKGASAGAYKCEDRFLDDIDEMQLRAMALRVVPKEVHLDEVAPCRNPDSAHAWISTKKKRSSEGVQQWYEFTCRRNAQPWICDNPEFRQSVSATVILGSLRHLIALSFDKDISANRARLLGQKALEIYSNPTGPLSECESDVLTKPSSVDFRNGPLPPADKAIDVRVSHEDLSDSVWLPDVSTEIHFSTSTDAPEATCASTVIVLA